MINQRSQKIEQFFNSRARKLTFKHVLLMQELEQLPPGTMISPDKDREIKMIEAELRQKLYGSLISDVLPVITTSSKEVKNES